MNVYFPRDLIRPCYRGKQLPIAGYKINDAYVVVDFSTSAPTNSAPTIGWLNKHNPLLNVVFVDDLPTIAKGNIILFNPPNFRNLEYFSMEPILLHLTGEEAPDPLGASLGDRLGANRVATCTPRLDDAVLDKLNQTLQVRGVQRPAHAWVRRGLESVVFVVQLVTAQAIALVNFRLGGHRLSDVSETLKQLDLRLRQFNYFPIQFLCYYDNSVATSLLMQQLGVPFLNTNLNINNSNYINLYNSLWLITNDVLLGMTAFRFVDANFDKILDYAHQLVDTRLFQNVDSLITWVSFNHPAGFKLNNELGQFMGNLFLWTLRFWRHVLVAPWPGLPLRRIVQVVCYCGLSFALCGLIDLFLVVTLHLYGFYHTATKVYNRQMECIKSLFQLFRGKKYNVLRHRLDSLDLDNTLRIDQLVLGTLMFMVLIYLLPTVFAFYLVFSVIRVVLLFAVNAVSSVITFINFMPLFVVLLKLKNSLRLQGGITIEYLETRGGVNYLHLRNKALTYNEILRHFYHLSRKNNLSRLNLVPRFVQGLPIALHDLRQLRFNYLMLPRHVTTAKKNP